MFSSRYHKSLGESFAYKEKNMGRNELIGEMSSFECQQYFNHITNEVSLADPLWRYITTMTTKPSFRIFGDAIWIPFPHSAVLRTNPPSNYILLCCLNPCLFRSSPSPCPSVNYQSTNLFNRRTFCCLLSYILVHIHSSISKITFQLYSSSKYIIIARHFQSLIHKQN